MKRPVRQEALHGEHTGLRQRRRLLERHASWLPNQRVFGRADILRKPSPTAQAETRQIAIDRIAGTKLRHAAARCCHSAGDVVVGGGFLAGRFIGAGSHLSISSLLPVYSAAAA